MLRGLIVLEFVDDGLEQLFFPPQHVPEIVMPGARDFEDELAVVLLEDFQEQFPFHGVEQSLHKFPQSAERNSGWVWRERARTVDQAAWAPCFAAETFTSFG